MSAVTPKPTVALWLRGLIVWALLLALLGLSLFSAYVAPAPWATVLTFGIAATQASLVALLFMRLDQADTLVRLAAACGLFWLAILFTLTLTDTLSRLANS
ncbi:cytochrome C oxidase subunit IV family protein [Methylobacterium sp. R2-1]|uniref:cytochrome C oxidase subunit IV family protein n=1 Tax=Methylobacterium sp. R2-1 TaxID=2587064 RepID=UPI0016144D1D|nr:cytochrome C oxidase subunit IV family protein [Methylobacterium sp. R2-1]MBB2961083.1 caa(3)-type oxidase subunit IV [Methylobacterium sp. R2-1]